ncbi:MULTISPECIES: chemotaxis protein CheB [unclassified Roseovarius]|uniref:chemotaxis protein CheB n=1 Tax=unclassified Roseovarius TaxID=2614913 RepID=UPI00273D26AF|nr:MULTISPECIES: chemotaxis protein CheB [unclassified Roseovarius]
MTDNDADLTIIGIGSSAGGLEAIRELVVTLPSDLPVSYVVVQHMSPNHKSLMTELVARQTDLEVADVEDKTVLKPNVIYITPPNNDVIYEDGHLRLREPSPDPASPKPSVNRFLQSLAENHGEKSMAIVLSGTGSDGAYGVQAIREVGGITIAQDTGSAKYDGMPHAAVQTGCVDLILRPLEIGTHLAKILSSQREFEGFRSRSPQDTPVSDLLQILLAKTRVDFREYKQTTIGRRIERRMVALGITSQEEYTQFCRNNPDAVDALFKDLLISVTRFFRDIEEFRELEQLLPKLLEERGEGPLRVWIAGCATGEEVYSIAMLLAEALGGPNVDLKSHVQIFATDIDKSALKIARGAVYNATALESIPRDLADKYVIRQKDGIRIIDKLRNAILFSDHNVCQDPPFQNVDLICCRNLLIYFGNSLQQKVLSRFHFAMTSDALLFLGTAETVAGSDELFVQHRKAGHIFHKRMLRNVVYGRQNFPMPIYSPRHKREKEAVEKEQSTDRQFFDALAQSMGKNSVLVTDDYSIVRVYGNISNFIEVSASSNLKMHLDLLRSPLREEARSLMTIALKNQVARSGVRHLLMDNDGEEVRLDVYPIIAKDINERAALVVFTPIKIDKAATRKDDGKKPDGKAAAERIRILENEVASTREALQQTIEELETSNEELQSLNEELQSTNEELQASNEELETSNEELQSTNEELITVNEELQVTTAELSGRTGELMSILESAPLAIVVVDSAFQIIQATRRALDMFNIRRPIATPHISHCALPEGFPSLAPICSEALQMGETVTREFTTNGNSVKLSCSPYFEENGQIQGATIVVSEFPRMAREMEMILQTDHVYLMHRDLNGTILRVSDAWARLLNVSADKAIGKSIGAFIGADAAERLLKNDAKFAKGDKDVANETLSFKSVEDGKVIWLNLTRYGFSDEESAVSTIYSVADDVTELVEAQLAAKASLNNMEMLHDFAGVGYWEVDLKTNTMHWSDKVYEIHKTTPKEFSPDLDNGIAFYHPDDRQHVMDQVARVRNEGGEFHFIKRIVCADKTEVTVESHGISIRDSAGDIIKISGFFREVPGDT